MSEIEARVKDIVVEQLGVNADEVTTDASFIDDEAEKITTVKEAVSYINSVQP